MLTNIFLGLWLILSIRRLLFWCQLWQQKEYRKDRFLIYLKEQNNYKSIFRYELIPFQHIRRPFFTVKAILLLLLSTTSLSLVGLYLLEFKFYWLYLLAVLILIPFIVAFWVLAVNIPSTVAKNYIIWKAKKIISSRKKTLTVIGITGSYGKTSTKQILEHVLRPKFSVFATKESHNTLFSIASDIVHYIKPENTVAIIEYAAYKRDEIKRIGRLIQPQIGVITGIAKQHLGLFGSYENLKIAKFELLQILTKKGVALINCNDASTKSIQEMAATNNIGFKCYLDSPYNLINPRLVNDHLTFDLKNNNENIYVNTKLFGKIYLENVRAVIYIAQLLGIETKSIAKALENFEPTNRFINLMDGVNASKILFDGNASNPKGFSSIIDLANELKYPEKILVTSGIVDLGSESENIHKSLGARAAKVFKLVFYASEVGRKSFTSGWKTEKSANLFQLTDISKIDILLKRINPDSLIVIEGRIPVRILKLLLNK